jgi:hypothetical protein
MEDSILVYILTALYQSDLKPSLSLSFVVALVSAHAPLITSIAMMKVKSRKFTRCAVIEDVSRNFVVHHSIYYYGVSHPRLLKEMSIVKDALYVRLTKAQ